MSGPADSIRDTGQRRYLINAKEREPSGSGSFA